MKCLRCKLPLVVSGHRTHEYRDALGRVYKSRRSPCYATCPCRIVQPAVKP